MSTRTSAAICRRVVIGHSLPKVAAGGKPGSGAGGPAAQASVIAPRSAPAARRAYLASTPVV